MAEKVQRLLAQDGLLTPFHSHPIYELETTTNTTTTLSSRTVRLLPQVMISLQCILSLVMTIFI
jgi:hypothetical protein